MFLKDSFLQVKSLLKDNITEADLAKIKTGQESIEMMQTGVPGIKQTEKSFEGNYEAPVFNGEFRHTDRSWFDTFLGNDLFEELEQPQKIPSSDAPEGADLELEMNPAQVIAPPVTVPPIMDPGLMDPSLMMQPSMGSQSIGDSMLRGIQRQRAEFAGRKVPNFDLHKTKFDGLFRPYPQYEPLTPNDGKKIKLRKENKMSGIYPAYVPYEPLGQAG